MQRKLFAVGALVFLGLTLAPVSASAQKKKGKDAAAKEEKAEDAKADKSKADKSKAEEKAEERGKGKGEKAGPKAEDTSDVKVEKVEKGDEGMKTYTFGPQEVEGRLKSPQIQYFLRRVRAEFEAGALGHRSFLRELSYTRHHPSLR
ncbi:MAG: hypothetical protein AB7K71_03300 [Polyangiaceae bacterium]